MHLGDMVDMVHAPHRLWSQGGPESTKDDADWSMFDARGRFVRAAVSRVYKTTFRARPGPGCCIACAHTHKQLPPPQGCIRREGTSEAVRQAVGGGCQSGWGRLLSVTNAIEAATWRQGDSGWA